MSPRSSQRFALGVLLSTFALSPWSMAQVPSFHLVGPEGARSTVRGVSGDGSTAVGWIWVDLPDGSQTATPFRWTFDGGLQPMPGEADPRAVSYDGSVVVGDSKPAGGFRWTADTGYTTLQDARAVRDVSADGSVAVGQGTVAGVVQPVVWDTNGAPSGLGIEGGSAACVSDDGLVVAGLAEAPGMTSPETFRWTEQSGLMFLGVLPGHSVRSSTAQACNRDGSVVFGNSTSSLGSWEVFRWTEASGMVGLGFLGRPQDVTPDGRVLVGYLFNGTVRPFIWDERNGAREFGSLLIDLGVDTSGWFPISLRACSDDGTVIGGDAFRGGQEERAFVAVIPHLCPCEVDGETSQVDVFDLLTYVDRWFGDDADLDGNGATDVFDLLDFLSCWFVASAGSCP